MVTEDEVLHFFREELSVLATWYLKMIPLESNTILQAYCEEFELFETIEKFADIYHVDISTMNWDNYYPWRVEWFFRKWFTHKPIKQNKKPLTVKMFADSVNTGKWLYD